jgi:C1A family cysteine protease
MTSLKKKFLTIFVVLFFLISISTIINASKSQQTPVECNKCFNFETKTEIIEPDECKCRLLNGKYAVMTERTPRPKTPIPNNEPRPIVSSENIPSQFSWKSYNGDWMSPVKDQGNCGSCWAFSATNTMEAAINIASGYPDTDIDLSEQYILSCLPYGGSCNGGWTDDCFESIISTSPSIGNGINGVPIESCMPYQQVDYIPCSDKCPDWDTYSEPPQETDILWQMESWGADHSLENDDPSDRDVVKTWLMDKGPMSVSMYASTSFSNYWSSHHNSDDWFFEEDHGYTNHAVVLVGWVDDPDVTNGGYWILKNSWGTDWGYGGYFNAAYGGQDIGEIVRWCKTFDWPEEEQGPGPGDYDMHVFANFNYGPDYPHLAEEIEFTDTSEGEVVLREWDFDGDGIIDSDKKNPEWTYMQEGSYEVTLKVWSQWGLSSNRTKTVEVKDNWPPVADIRPLLYPDPEHPKNDLEVHFDARYSYDPDGNIVDYVWDFGDGTSSSEPYLYHTFPNPDTIYIVSLTLYDNEGKAGTAQREIMIDQNVPPETTIRHGFESKTSTWYDETQRISFAATDWTKVINTYYRIDGGDWERYIASEHQYIPVSTEGEHTVEVYSVDYWNNEETPVTETFFIDKTDPSVDMSLSGTQEDGWYINKVTVTLSGEDALSGIYKLFYKYKTSDWVEYNSPFTIDDRTGTVNLHFMAVDNAGNQDVDEAQIKIKDMDAPDIPDISGPSRAAPGQELTYTIVTYDPDNEIYYFVDWGDEDTDGWLGPFDSGEEITITHTYISQGSYELKVKAKNQYDAESPWASFDVTMPRNRKIQLFSLLLKIFEQNPLMQNLLKYLMFT